MSFWKDKWSFGRIGGREDSLMIVYLGVNFSTARRDQSCFPEGGI